MCHTQSHAALLDAGNAYVRLRFGHAVTCILYLSKPTKIKKWSILYWCFEHHFHRTLGAAVARVIPVLASSSCFHKVVRSIRAGFIRRNAIVVFGFSGRRFRFITCTGFVAQRLSSIVLGTTLLNVASPWPVMLLSIDFTLLYRISRCLYTSSIYLNQSCLPCKQSF